MMALQLLSYKSTTALMKSCMPTTVAAVLMEGHQIRFLKPNRHQRPEFKNLRRLKVDITVPLKYQQNFVQAVKDGVMQGIPFKSRVWKERDLYVSCSYQTLDEFVPPEDSSEGLTQALKDKWNSVGQFGKDKLSLRKLRTYESEFNRKVFLEEAVDTYIKAHKCLAADDQENLTNFVTESARVAMLSNSSKRTVHWKYLQTLEEPKIVQIRTFELDENQNSFSQITVRMFSQQCMAVYDRFGRLIYGSEILAKDVLEYVVFEKHISNEYGKWRVHSKIIPDKDIGVAEQTYIAPKGTDNESAVVVPVENKTEAQSRNS